MADLLVELVAMGARSLLATLMSDVLVEFPAVGPGDLYLLALKKDFAPAGEPVRLTFFNWQPGGAAWTSNGREVGRFSH